MNLITFEKTKGVFSKAKIFHYWDLPVKHNKNNIHNSIISNVDDLLKIKQEDIEQNEINLENKINQLVYQLYELTEEEIQIVESNVG